MKKEWAVHIRGHVEDIIKLIEVYFLNGYHKYAQSNLPLFWPK